MFEKLRGMKRDSVISVFNAVIDRKNTSRTVISEDTGLSYVTVGKIVDAFIEEDIFKQSFTNRCALLKRKSMLVSAKPKYWIGVYTIRSDKFTFSVYDMNSVCMRAFVHKPEESIFIDDLIRDFIIRVEKFVNEFFYISDCCGISVLVPGNYDPKTDRVTDSEISHLCTVRIKEFFSKYTFGHVPHVASLYTSFAMEISRTLPDDRCALTVFLDKNCIKTAYAVADRNGRMYVKDIGLLQATVARRFSSIVKVVPQPEPLFEGLSDLIFVLMNTLHITDIVIAGYLYKNFQAVPPVLLEYIEKLCAPERLPVPEIRTADLNTLAKDNISREMWRRWLLDTVLYEDNV